MRWSSTYYTHQSSTCITPVQYIHHTSPVHTTHTSPVHTSHQSCTFNISAQYNTGTSPVHLSHTYVSSVGLLQSIVYGLWSVCPHSWTWVSEKAILVFQRRALNNNQLVVKWCFGLQRTLPEALHVLFALMWHSTLSTIMQLPVGMELTLWYATISCVMSF